MKPEQFQINQFNEEHLNEHMKDLSFLKSKINNSEEIIKKLIDFQIAIPSWALGTGGTRFARFSAGGEPRKLEEKIEDAGLLHALNRSCGSLSLHIPWDIPENAQQVKAFAALYGIRFDAMNSNTFQDQNDQEYSYKFGS